MDVVRIDTFDPNIALDIKLEVILQVKKDWLANKNVPSYYALYFLFFSLALSV